MREDGARGVTPEMWKLTGSFAWARGWGRLGPFTSSWTKSEEKGKKGNYAKENLFLLLRGKRFICMWVNKFGNHLTNCVFFDREVSVI